MATWRASAAFGVASPKTKIALRSNKTAAALILFIGRTKCILHPVCMDLVVPHPPRRVNGTKDPRFGPDFPKETYVPHGYPGRQILFLITCNRDDFFAREHQNVLAPAAGFVCARPAGGWGNRRASATGTSVRFPKAHLAKPEMPQSINCFLHQFERELPCRHFSCKRRGLTRPERCEIAVALLFGLCPQWC
jgi:hypothetical protein